MLDQADLVVIASPGLATLSTEAGIEAGTKVRGIFTELAIRAVLKGKAANSISFHHYRADPKNQVHLNGPTLVEFDAADHSSYLFFLVREPSGSYAPVTGQTDPLGTSVQKLGGYTQ